MLHEHVEFLEGGIVEQQFDALARGELAAGVLGVDALLASAKTSFAAAAFQFGEHGFHGPGT
jgi:hypothetical protein